MRSGFRMEMAFIHVGVEADIRGPVIGNVVIGSGGRERWVNVSRDILDTKHWPRSGP